MIADTPHQLASWLESLGSAGLGLVALGGVLWTMVLLPVSVLYLSIGALYGPWLGTPIAFLINAVAGALAFTLSRTILRQPIERRVQGSKTFDAIDRAVGEGGLGVAFLVRLSALPPWLINYGLGVTSMRFRNFLVASVSAIPVIWVFVASGSAIGDLGGITESSQTRSTGEWVILVVGIVATAGALLVVGRRTRAILQETKMHKMHNDSTNDG